MFRTGSGVPRRPRRALRRLLSPILLGVWPITRLWYRAWGLRLDGRPGDPVWYFAYGANMHPSAFRDRRGMRPSDTRTGRVAGYRLRFNLDGWPRGRSAPANIRPDADAEVWGVLYRIARRDLVRLNASEGVPGKGYRPVLLEAENDAGETVQAFAYVARGNARDGRPSLRYITLIREGARRHGLPDRWLAHLDRVPHAEEAADTRAPGRPARPGHAAARHMDSRRGGEYDSGHEARRGGAGPEPAGRARMGRLDGRVAVVTGGGRGIGVAYCKALAAEGAKVVVSDIIDTENTVNIIKQAGGEAVGNRCDVTRPEETRAMVAQAVETYGRLDIMVTNAALFADLKQRSFLEIDEDEWDRVMRINTRGVFSCVKAAVPEMKKNGYGKIINIASGTVFKGTPMMLHYVSSKGAMVAFTRALAREVGDDGINVNAIAPGLTMSEKVLADEQWTRIQAGNTASRAIKREEVPEDLIGALIFFSSSDSDFVTGQTMVVDGGSAMH